MSDDGNLNYCPDRKKLLWSGQSENAGSSDENPHQHDDQDDDEDEFEQSHGYLLPLIWPDSFRFRSLTIA